MRHRSAQAIIIERKGPEVLKPLSGNLGELRGPDGTRLKETTGMVRRRDHMSLSGGSGERCPTDAVGRIGALGLSGVRC